MGVKNSDLTDLIATTLEDLPEQYFEVTWDNNDYEFCRIYQNERMDVDGGTSIKRKVMLDHSGNARYRRLYDTDEPGVSDVMETIDVPWTQIGTHYSWDKLEILRNKSNAKGFIKLIKARRIDGLWSLANKIEERAWKTPTNSSDDLYPYGVPYYLNAVDADSTTAGFVGKTIRYQDGSTGTSCAGLDANTNSRWKNYAATYNQVDNELLRAFRKAFMKTKFKAPLFINDPAQKRQGAKRVYTNADVATELQDLADQRDDRHTGKEILGNIRIDDGGLVYLNRLPVIYISQLDDMTDPETGDTMDPIYCVDFRKFIPIVQEDYWLDEGEPMTDRGQHTTFTVFLDGSHNNLCVNRREAGFVMTKPLTS